MITAKDVRTVLGQLAEAKHQDFYIDFTGDLLHSMAAPMGTEFGEGTCLVLGNVAQSLLLSRAELLKRYTPSNDMMDTVAGLVGRYGADDVPVLTDVMFAPEVRVLNKDLVCVAVIRDGCVIDYRAALVY